METTVQNGELISYIEIPRQCLTPIKIDKILEERMKAFMKARNARHISFIK